MIACGQSPLRIGVRAMPEATGTGSSGARHMLRTTVGASTLRRRSEIRFRDAACPCGLHRAETHAAEFGRRHDHVMAVGVAIQEPIHSLFVHEFGA